MIALALRDAPSGASPQLVARVRSNVTRFCQACGQSLAPPPLTCAACETDSPPTAKFCINCGQVFGDQAVQVFGDDISAYRRENVANEKNLHVKAEIKEKSAPSEGSVFDPRH